MKATGIIRRIDDLGRVVITKEIRRTLRLREGDPLEIYLDNDMVCFKKYDPEINYAKTLNDLRSEFIEDFDIKPEQEYKQNVLEAFDTLIAAINNTPKEESE